MAALDFGMALARGMLPTSEKAQQDLLKLSGGRNIFKSEDWWNQQVDKQISEGYRSFEPPTYTPPQATMSPFSLITSYGGMDPGTYYAATSPSLLQIQGKSIGAGGTGRKDFTAGELADIERSAEAGAKRTKAQSEASKASQRRLRRGTGGLVGKARLPGDAPSTGLPELGTTGLGMTAGLFGADIKL